MPVIGQVFRGGELFIEAGVLEYDADVSADLCEITDLLFEELAVPLQTGIAGSNLTQHLIEPVDQRSDFIL